MQPLLEKRLDFQRGRKAEKRAEDFRKLVVPLMSNDTQAHQTARRWVPRMLSIPKAELTRCAMPRASSPYRASCVARGACSTNSSEIPWATTRAEESISLTTAAM